MKNLKITDSYISLDLETTGLSPKHDKVIEIGAVKVYKNQIVDTFSTFVNPGVILRAQISKLTSISQEQLSEAPLLREIFPAFNVWLEDLPFLGHQILFDYSFLKKEAFNQDISFEKEGIDTLKAARELLTELPSKTLEAICLHYEIPHKAHRAKEDAIATHLLYQRLCQSYPDYVFKQRELVFRTKKDTPASKKEKERLQTLISRHKLSVTYDIEQLTRSEASRYTDKILSKYGK